MTEDQSDRMVAYVRELADGFGLRDWALIVDPNPPDHDECDAQIEPAKGRKIARIWFAPAFFDLPPDRRRQTVCHELLHCHLDGIKRAYEALSGKVHPDAFDVGYEGVILQLEMGIDGIAEAVAPFFPLPENNQ